MSDAQKDLLDCFSAEAKAALEWIASRKNITVVEAAEQAIRTQKLIIETVERGGVAHTHLSGKTQDLNF
ncbi:MAG: hypothetical protein WCD70_07010 [Alphaproteobacteria bacterium]